jgi:hypothetical protein
LSDEPFEPLDPLEPLEPLSHQPLSDEPFEPLFHEPLSEEPFVSHCHPECHDHLCQDQLASALCVLTIVAASVIMTPLSILESICCISRSFKYILYAVERLGLGEVCVDAQRTQPLCIFWIRNPAVFLETYEDPWLSAPASQQV